MNIGPMLNLYPDSLGGTLDDVVDFLKLENVDVLLRDGKFQDGKVEITLFVR